MEFFYLVLKDLQLSNQYSTLQTSHGRAVNGVDLTRTCMGLYPFIVGKLLLHLLRNVSSCRRRLSAPPVQLLPSALTRTMHSIFYFLFQFLLFCFILCSIFPVPVFVVLMEFQFSFFALSFRLSGTIPKESSKASVAAHDM
ncbi:hypothetical protein M9H77_00173 [Catharanthus roseus]|nr:hypothetical protein M9H77_00173 [Catharanthus roseus]